MYTSADYDAPRQSDGQDVDDERLQMIKSLRGDVRSEANDVDDTDPNDASGLLIADLSSLMSADEYIVRVVPKQADEFVCSSCFLIHPRSRLSGERGQSVCRDCG